MRLKRVSLSFFRSFFPPKNQSPSVFFSLPAPTQDRMSKHKLPPREPGSEDCARARGRSNSSEYSHKKVLTYTALNCKENERRRRMHTLLFGGIQKLTRPLRSQGRPLLSLFCHVVFRNQVDVRGPLLLLAGS